MTDRVMTPQEVADLYRVSKQTVFRWVASGMPCIRPGRRIIRFERAAVEDWVASKQTNDQEACACGGR